MTTVPTAADLKERFPFFASVDDGMVAEYITQAGRNVDDSWLVDDQASATTYLACHLMYVDGVASGGTPPGGAGGAGFVTSKSIGDSSTSYGTSSYLKGGGSATDQYRSTVWGRNYLDLLRKNQPGILVI